MENNEDFDKYKGAIASELLEHWQQEQTKLKREIITHDTEEWQKTKTVYKQGEQFDRKKSLRYIGGLDISFKKDNTDHVACVGLVVLELGTFQVVYMDFKVVDLVYPYVPGFLAFREAPFFLQLLDKLKQEKPQLMPQCLMIDGNGIFHKRRCGIASHIGVLCDLPTVGVAKSLYGAFGIENNLHHKNKIKQMLLKRGDYFELYPIHLELNDYLEADSNIETNLLALCYRSTDDSANPLYISIGHKLSWSTVVWIVDLVSKHRVPEPIRQADLLTRQYIRENIT